MTKFVFRLQAVLRLKKQLEQNIKNEFGKAMQKLETEKQKLEQIRNEQTEHMEQLKQDGEKGISVERLREINVYIMALRDRLIIQKDIVKEARENADKHREMLIKAVQEREILEKLKEKQYEEYLQSVKKEEQKILDEIAGYKYYIGLAGE